MTHIYNVITGEFSERPHGTDGRIAPTVDGRVTAVRRAEAKAQQGPRTTRSAEQDEPLVDNDLPDDWYHCAHCGKDCDPAEVKLAYSDLELCGEECNAGHIKALEQSLLEQELVSAKYKAALRKIMQATEGKRPAELPLLWFAIRQYIGDVNQIAVNGLYLIKDEVTECQTKS